MSPRRPLDTIPQVQLAFELRHAIDRVRRRPWDSNSVHHLDDLIAANPRSVRSTHVAYNIGKVRYGWMESRTSAAPLQVDATDPRSSLVPYELSQEENMVRDNPDLAKTVVTNVGPDQQGDAHRLAQEHAQEVANQAATQQIMVIRGDAKPTVKKEHTQ